MLHAEHPRVLRRLQQGNHWSWFWLPRQILARHLLWLRWLRHDVLGREVRRSPRPKALHLLRSHGSWTQQCRMIFLFTIHIFCFGAYLPKVSLLYLSLESLGF